MAQVNWVLLAAAGAAALFAASSLVAPAADAASGASMLPVGWTLVEASGCVTGQTNGVTYLYIYPTTGGMLWTNEQDLVASISTFCAYGSYFYAFSANGSTWDNTYYTASLNY